MAMVSVYSNSHHRVHGRAYSQLTDWDKHGPRRFELKLDRPQLPNSDSSRRAEHDQQSASSEPSLPKNHKQFGVKSVIDLQTWDKAVWRGCGYMRVGSDLPPIMLLLFDDSQAGRKIFDRLKERFGESDESEEIAISIIRNIPGWLSDHYIAQITSKMPEEDTSKVLTTPIRSLEVTPPNSQNLDLFLEGYQEYGAFGLMPGLMSSTPGSQPDIDFDLAIHKRHINIIDANDVSENQSEAISLKMRGIALPQS